MILSFDKLLPFFDILDTGNAISRNILVLEPGNIFQLIEYNEYQMYIRTANLCHCFRKNKTKQFFFSKQRFSVG